MATAILLRPHTDQGQTVKVPSGKVFPIAEYLTYTLGLRVETDGALTVLTRDRPGWQSSYDDPLTLRIRRNCRITLKLDTGDKSDWEFDTRTGSITLDRQARSGDRYFNLHDTKDPKSGRYIGATIDAAYLPRLADPVFRNTDRYNMNFLIHKLPGGHKPPHLPPRPKPQYLKLYIDPEIQNPGDNGINPNWTTS